jgi:hypothetical protein
MPRLMKHLLLLLLLSASVLRAEQTKPSLFWDSSKTLPISGDCTAIAGPVWKTSGPALDMDKTPPDFYRISVEKKTASSSVPVFEKDYPISEVDWPRLKKTSVADIIKYHAATFRVGFFLKGPTATFIHTLTSATETTDVTPVSTPLPASAATATDSPLAVTSSTLTASTSADLAKAKRFVPSVVYHVEKGVREYKTKRWATLPLLEIVSKETELSAFATSLNNAIFTAAGPLPAGKGKLTIYIGPAKDVIPVRKKIAPQSGDANWFYWSHWNGNREFIDGSIFIVSDRMSAQEAKRALAVCLMGTAGFPDESREYRESIMHPDSKSTELALIDKRMISFIYKHTEPGIAREAMLTSMNANWE